MEDLVLAEFFLSALVLPDYALVPMSSDKRTTVLFKCYNHFLNLVIKCALNT